MIEMPPLQFAQTNGIRMGYYEAGPVSDAPPMVLCHGWPELAFSWRHQIKALAEAGIRVIAPDQRGYGVTDRPDSVETYDIEHLTGDLVGLLDHLKIDKAIFVGHDWGGFIVWQMPLRHPSRVAGVVGINTPHSDRAPADPISLYRKRFGDSMYIVQFQDPAQQPDKIFGSRVAETFDFFMRKPMIGPGTGLAPFRGFLQERAAQKAKGATLGPSLLFFGCRHPEQDYLYADELKAFADQGITELHVAFSRASQPKTYVQHMIAQQKDRVWDLIEKGAIIYVCGDGGKMEPDVKAALMAIYRERSGANEEAAARWIDDLGTSNRYVLDVWAGG